MDSFKISNARYDEMDFFLSLAKEEGWNPGLHDSKPFYSTDPNGFFISTLHGKKIGCISAVAYNNIFGFLGFYIVIPEYRGQGFGLELWNHAIKYLGNRSIGLDGVLAQQDAYKKSQFQLSYRNIRFEGAAGRKCPHSLTQLSQVPIQKVLDYDSSVMGFSRETFLVNWIQMPNAYALGKFDNDQLQGYGVIRRCVKGHKIGPLFADNFEVARELYDALSAEAGTGPVFFDVPEIHLESMQIAEMNSCKKVFETARMYKGPTPDQQLHKIFGITSFELG